MTALSRVSHARRIAVKAAYGGGSVGLIGAAFAGVLIGQAKLARRAIPALDPVPPPCDGLYGKEFHGKSITLALIGDSSAAGLGVSVPRETPGALLATGLARMAQRPVRLICVAVVGAISADLYSQVDKAIPHQPDAAVIFIGGNDVVNRVWPPIAVRHLDQAVRRLVDTGTQVVVGTCPDLGTIQPIQPPLRWLARRWSRQLAAAQTIATIEAGGRTVSLGDLLGPEFAARPDEMFASDHFHPSAAGYASATAAVLPSLAAALGYGEELPTAPTPTRREEVRPLPHAAVEAARTSGTEVSATEVGGRERGIQGRWAQLQHRIRRFTRSPEDPSVHENDRGEHAVEGAP